MIVLYLKQIRKGPWRIQMDKYILLLTISCCIAVIAWMVIIEFIMWKLDKPERDKKINAMMYDGGWDIEED